jgi:hypothetical protein
VIEPREHDELIKALRLAREAPKSAATQTRHIPCSDPQSSQLRALTNACCAVPWCMNEHSSAHLLLDGWHRRRNNHSEGGTNDYARLDPGVRSHGVPEVIWPSVKLRGHTAASRAPSLETERAGT